MDRQKYEGKWESESEMGVGERGGSKNKSGTKLSPTARDRTGLTLFQLELSLYFNILLHAIYTRALLHEKLRFRHIWSKNFGIHEHCFFIERLECCSHSHSHSQPYSHFLPFFPCFAFSAFPSPSHSW